MMHELQRATSQWQRLKQGQCTFLAVLVSHITLRVFLGQTLLKHNHIPVVFSCFLCSEGKREKKKKAEGSYSWGSEEMKLTSHLLAVRESN